MAPPPFDSGTAPPSLRSGRAGVSAPIAPEAAADRALAAACAAGNAGAWERLVGLHELRVATAVQCVLASAGIRDRSLEDELVMETFAEVAADDARALREFRGEARLGTFLSVIAGRLAGKAIRSRAAETRARREASRRAAAAILDSSETVFRRAESGERGEVLGAAMDELLPRDRRMLSLFHVEGRSYKEIAVALNISPASVGAELARARDRLARRLRERGLDSEGDL